ncbi:hypothetical protein, partial [Vibrio paracholerae]
MKRQCVWRYKFCVIASL